MNGCIKVFNVGTGALNGTLENDETTNEAMPISRIRCKPNGENTIVAATYVSGHLRLWNYTNGQCVGHVTYLTYYVPSFCHNDELSSTMS